MDALIPVAHHRGYITSTSPFLPAHEVTLSPVHVVRRRPGHLLRRASVPATLCVFGIAAAVLIFASATQHGTGQSAALLSKLSPSGSTYPSLANPPPAPSSDPQWLFPHAGLVQCLVQGPPHPSEVVFKIPQVDMPKTDKGDGESFVLEKQDVNCGNFPINSFHLRAVDEGSSLTYRIKCASGAQLATTQEKSTTPVDAGGGNILALDNLDVDCGPGAAISQFRLVRDGDQIKYVYTCKTSSKAETFMDCADLKTESNAGGEGGFIIQFLDRHTVACPANKVLQQFQLNTRDPGEASGTINYEYRCCSVNGILNEATMNLGIPKAQAVAMSEIKMRGAVIELLVKAGQCTLETVGICTTSSNDQLAEKCDTLNAVALQEEAERKARQERERIEKEDRETRERKERETREIEEKGAKALQDFFVPWIKAPKDDTVFEGVDLDVLFYKDEHTLIVRCSSSNPFPKKGQGQFRIGKLAPEKKGDADTNMQVGQVVPYGHVSVIDLGAVGYPGLVISALDDTKFPAGIKSILPTAFRVVSVRSGGMQLEVAAPQDGWFPAGPATLGVALPDGSSKSVVYESVGALASTALLFTAARAHLPARRILGDDSDDFQGIPVGVDGFPEEATWAMPIRQIAVPHQKCKESPRENMNVTQFPRNDVEVNEMYPVSWVSPNRTELRVTCPTPSVFEKGPAQIVVYPKEKNVLQTGVKVDYVIVVPEAAGFGVDEGFSGGSDTESEIVEAFRDQIPTVSRSTSRRLLQLQRTPKAVVAHESAATAAVPTTGMKTKAATFIKGSPLEKAVRIFVNGTFTEKKALMTKKLVSAEPVKATVVQKPVAISATKKEIISAFNPAVTVASGRILQEEETPAPAKEEETKKAAPKKKGESDGEEDNFVPNTYDEPEVEKAEWKSNLIFSAPKSKPFPEKAAMVAPAKPVVAAVKKDGKQMQVLAPITTFPQGPAALEVVGADGKSSSVPYETVVQLHANNDAACISQGVLITAPPEVKYPENAITAKIDSTYSDYSTPIWTDIPKTLDNWWEPLVKTVEDDVKSVEDDVKAVEEPLLSPPKAVTTTSWPDTHRGKWWRHFKWHLLVICLVAAILTLIFCLRKRIKMEQLRALREQGSAAQAPQAPQARFLVCFPCPFWNSSEQTADAWFPWKKAAVKSPAEREEEASLPSIKKRESPFALQPVLNDDTRPLMRAPSPLAELEDLPLRENLAAADERCAGSALRQACGRTLRKNYGTDSAATRTWVPDRTHIPYQVDSECRRPPSTGFRT